MCSLPSLKNLWWFRILTHHWPGIFAMTVNTAPGECTTFLTNKITCWETNHMSLTCAFSSIAAYYSCTSPATPALMLWVSECLVRHVNVFIFIALKPFALGSKYFICSNLLFVLPGDHPRHVDQNFPFSCGDSSDVILLRKEPVICCFLDWWLNPSS